MRDYRAGYVGDGFQIPRIREAGQELRVHLSHWSAELERVLTDSGATAVAVTPWWQDDEGGLDRLGAFGGQIRQLGVGWENAADCSWIEQLPKLERLALSCPVDTVDFTKLASLRTCSLAGRASLGNLPACHRLEDLSLADLRIRDLGQLRTLRALRRLSLVELRHLVSLEGIQGLPLEQVELIELARLASLAPVTSAETLAAFSMTGCPRVMDLERVGEVPALHSLLLTTCPELRSFDFVGKLGRLREFGIWGTKVAGDRVSVGPLAGLPDLRVLKLISGARNIVDIERLEELTVLEVLMIDSGPTVASLSFLKRAHQLREIALVKTRIQDGQLGVLLELPRLERIEITPHLRHYSHTLDQLNAVLVARRGSSGQRETSASDG